MVVLHFWIILFFKNYILTGWFIIVTYQFTVKNFFFALQMYVTINMLMKKLHSPKYVIQVDAAHW